MKFYYLEKIPFPLSRLIYIKGGKKKITPSIGRQQGDKCGSTELNQTQGMDIS